MNGVSVVGSGDDGDYDDYNEGEQEEFEGGYGYGDEEESDAGMEMEDEAMLAIKADTAPPPMPEGFYDQLDQFLAKPAPQISAFGTKKSVPGTGKSGEALPRLRSDSDGKAAKRATGGLSMVKSKLSASKAMDHDVERRFDPVLLQEAFAYADRVQREAALDEESGFEEPPQPQRQQTRPPAKSGSAPQLSTGGGGRSFNNMNPYERQLAMQKSSSKKQSGKSTKRKEGVVKRLRSQTSFQSDEAAFSNISGAGLEHSSKKTGIDVDSLVENFENGILLNKLRAELAASQRSIQESESFMKKLSTEYGNSKRKI